MSRIKIASFVAWNVLLVFCVVLIMKACFTPDPVEIIKKEIQYNTIERDPGNMPADQVQQELQCYYKGIPFVDIQKGGGNDYVLSAGLCERKWQRIVSIKPRDSPRNMVISGVVINDGEISGMIQYYRLFGRIGFGGGISASETKIGLTGGAVITW